MMVNDMTLRSYAHQAVPLSLFHNMMSFQDFDDFHKWILGQCGAILIEQGRGPSHSEKSCQDSHDSPFLK